MNHKDGSDFLIDPSTIDYDIDISSEDDYEDEDDCGVVINDDDIEPELLSQAEALLAQFRSRKG